MNGQASLGDRVLQEQGPPVGRDIADLGKGMVRDWWVFTERAKEHSSPWSVTAGGPLHLQACWFLTGTQEFTLPWKHPCRSRCDCSGPSDGPVNATCHSRFSSELSACQVSVPRPSSGCVLTESGFLFSTPLVKKRRPRGAKR